MYSAAMSRPLEGVMRPSSASDAMNERWPRMSSALTCSSAARQRAGTSAFRAGVCASAEAVSRSASAAHAKRLGAGRARLRLRGFIKDSLPFSFDLHAAPESHAVFYLRGRVLRLRVEPRRVLVHVAADDHVVIARSPLPAADGVRLALAEVLAPNRVGGEVVVALHHDRVVALRNHLALPGRLH